MECDQPFGGNRHELRWPARRRYSLRAVIGACLALVSCAAVSDAVEPPNQRRPFPTNPLTIDSGFDQPSLLGIAETAQSDEPAGMTGAMDGRLTAPVTPPPTRSTALPQSTHPWWEDTVVRLPSVAQRPTEPDWEQLPPPRGSMLPATPIDQPELPDSAGHATGAGRSVPFDPSAFSDTPAGLDAAYDARLERSVYEGRYDVPTQRPLIELGRGLYLPGPIPPSPTWLGPTNPVAQHLLVYGDYRIGQSYNQQLGDDAWVVANRLNLDIDWKLTATERFHAFWGPLDQGADFTRFEIDGGEFEFFNNLDTDLDALFFEGDLGAILGGFTGRNAPFDLPVAVGRIPLFLQNGVWMEDAITGAAATIQARNSPLLGIANYDLTFFVGFDDLNTPALPDDEAGNVYGIHGFFDMLGGYLETGYGFVDDRSGEELGYHNVAVSFTRRYRQRYSNSVRYLANFGQQRSEGDQSADGHLVLVETSFRTPRPQTVVPYLNLFAGFDRPQSLGRAAVAGGVLRNTGINFETDGLTGYPTLDANAQNTFGGALGLNLLGPVFDYQLVMELAWLQPVRDASESSSPGDQYGLGLRYQLPLTNALILRMDAMHGILENSSDITGARTELRFKF